ncbi:hypothetical protein NMG60_11025575 [Bertholletia excelsa]
MADLVSYGNPERDIEQALITLKKGTQLVKYSRKGKPKLCPFRLSPDETTLIWLSHGHERNLKLSSVTRIVPGQRTVVFKRYLRPEKEYLSFSLIYNNGERSLDLICKDTVEVEVWLAGLKFLICTDQNRLGRTPGDISDASLNCPSSDVVSDANMQGRTSVGDAFRLSVSSTPSCSSQGSGPDDIESLGDVYVWGEVWCDTADGSMSAYPTDILVPKPLESNVVLDVHQIACGVRHFALVTRQGEVFTWGEESGGRLGHGIEKDFCRPRLVEFLAATSVDFVACGEYHTCAISVTGDLYTWGDGAYNAGLLGNGTDVSHWIPKRVSGPLEGLQVISVACGTWHSGLVTSNGKLFTFGDGSFGALGHGGRESVPYPREVQSLSGLKTIKVACGVWHTAAIVEVMSQMGSNVSSTKLFTWGDGEKNRLGHGNKDAYLLPTCVSALIDYNFHQVACGHFMTVALTTSGHVFTMGSAAYGVLGNPQSDGKVPCLVQDKLFGEYVEEISCGAYHVAVLTSRNELFTWGRGANGRLGHGDTEDKRTPTLVEALKDRYVKNISCGTNFTASICVHKWVSGADQSVCTGCRQAFGFTRKRHNCYNCGLVHCHPCSSRKALRAALAPTPSKPHRVCDSCYAKLKSAETGSGSYFKKRAASRYSLDGKEKLDKAEAKSSRTMLSPTTEPIKYLEVKSANHGTRNYSSSITGASQAPSLLQLKDVTFPNSLSALQNAFTPFMVVSAQPLPQPPTPPPVQTAANSRPTSPYSRRPSPPRSATPVFSKGVIDSLKKTNDVLNQEVSKLQNQIRSLKQKSKTQDAEIQKLQKNTQEAVGLAAREASQHTVAKEVVKFVAFQLKEIMDKLPPEIDIEAFKDMHAHIEDFLTMNKAEESGSHPSIPSYLVDESTSPDGTRPSETREGLALHRNESSLTLPEASTGGKQKEIIEQFEPGVYVTLIRLEDGSKIFKRVRFSRRRFAEHDAEEWWKENKDRLLRKYSSTMANSTGPDSTEDNTEEEPSS